MINKTCVVCKVSKPTTEFRSRGGAQKHLLDSRCKKCKYAEHRRWCEANPSRIQKYRARDSWTLTKRCNQYNISPEEFIIVYEKQGGKCAVCNILVTIADSAIDHNHSTGKFRGILCKTCNRALGLLKDNPAILHRAAAYLEKHGSYGNGA